ncbi:OmpA/MotB family protein [Desulfoplanes formicivorans]|uniref:OmpA/MotB domain protein n=1 Tax=Desulfoplanes formicivorans TaxID=1592317 RepID=A0A194AHY9_9BACT|nr:flagellar motor protein MotB [Desulfoplanes formicivorans]GAU08384.1 OmpA/MotB domain protein [Desulfoplanes formicivorans]
MARKRERGVSTGGSGGGWLVTFSDLMTLLLTFFVLLLSMSSMDKTVIMEVASFFKRNVSSLTEPGAGRIESRYEILRKLLEDPLDAINKPDRIKDLLFPNEVLPPGISRSTLDNNLLVLNRPEGVALVLTDRILFPLGQTTLTPLGESLVHEIGRFLMTTTASVNLAGYTDSIPAKTIDNYEIAARRAMSVLRSLVGMGMRAKRFSVSGYGPHFPLADNATPEGRAQNRRIEILIKTGSFTYL